MRLIWVSKYMEETCLGFSLIAGEALFSLITDPDTIESRFAREFTMDDEEESLVVFLNELLCLWDTEKFLPGRFSVSEDREACGHCQGRNLQSRKASCKKRNKGCHLSQIRHTAAGRSAESHYLSGYLIVQNY